MRMFALLLLSVSCFAPRAQAGVLLQGFYWDAPSGYTQPWWWDTLASKGQEIANAGFTAVWIPPVLKGAAGGYSNGYDPYDDYDIGSKNQMGTVPTHWGPRENLLRTVGVLRANGLEVYVDDVLGQRNGDSGNYQFHYKDAFGNDGQGRFPKDQSDFQTYSSGFGRAPNYNNTNFTQGLTAAGDWMLNTLGAQGLRIDLATKVNPGFLSYYLSQGAMAGKFTVAEFWSENIDEVSGYVNAMGGRVSVFDFCLWGMLKDMSNAGGFYDMSRLQHAGYSGRDPAHAVTFVENHDTDRGYPTRQNKHLGYAYILTSEGYPSVFWKDYYEYGLKKVIDPLIWIHENLAEGSTEYRWADQDLLVYERHGKRGLLVGLNDNASSQRRQQVQTAFGANAKLHDYTGNQPDITTDGGGKVWLTVGANSYVAYAPSGIRSTVARNSYLVAQQIAGASDLDVKPALPGAFAPAQRIYMQGGTTLKAALYWQNGLDSGSTMQIGVGPDGAGPSTIINQGGAGPGMGTFTAPSTGWYTIYTRVEARARGQNEVAYWLNIAYQAPKTIQP